MTSRPTARSMARRRPSSDAVRRACGVALALGCFLLAGCSVGPRTADTGLVNGWSQSLFAEGVASFAQQTNMTATEQKCLIDNVWLDAKVQRDQIQASGEAVDAELGDRISPQGVADRLRRIGQKCLGDDWLVGLYRPKISPVAAQKCANALTLTRQDLSEAWAAALGGYEQPTPVLSKALAVAQEACGNPTPTEGNS